MIGSSPIYILCLVIVLLDSCSRVKICAAICIFHIIVENCIDIYFRNNILLFDLGLYLTILWSLDILLVISCLTILSGIRKKLIVVFCGIIVILQLIFLQYPYLNDFIASLLIQEAYFMFIE